MLTLFSLLLNQRDCSPGSDWSDLSLNLTGHTGLLTVNWEHKRIYLNQLPLFSELSASDPLRLVLPRPSSSFFRSLQEKFIITVQLYNVQLTLDRVYNTATLPRGSPYLFLDCFLVSSSRLSSSSSQLSVSPSRMGGMETLR